MKTYTYEKILSIVAFLFIVVADVFAFIKQECDGIDNIYLNCRVTGTFWDYLGFAMLNLPMLYLIWRTFNPTYASSRGEGNFLSMLPYLIMIVGSIIIWNF